MESFFNRSGLCQFSSYKEELAFDGAVGKNNVLLEGNPGYGISYTLIMGPELARVFRQAAWALFLYRTKKRLQSHMWLISTPEAAPMAGHVSLRLS